MKFCAAILAAISAVDVCHQECYWESPTGAKGSPSPTSYCQEAAHGICQYAQATTAGYQPADSFDCTQTCAQVDPKTGKCWENPGSDEPPVNNKCFCKSTPADPYTFCAESATDSVLRAQKPVNTTTAYDPKFDVKTSSMNTVACSDGAHGLAAKYPTFGSLPTFPYIAGIPQIAGWNSESCGTCWKLTYNGTSINVIGIDHADGENLSLEAMNKLTQGQAVKLGRIQSYVEQVDNSVCGL